MTAVDETSVPERDATTGNAAPASTAPGGTLPNGGDPPDGAQRGPTAAQLRRFIKSRPYVPLHELRRRFELNGDLDEVTPIDTPDGGRVFVGLPERESRFLETLVRDGDIGMELSFDPRVPIVVGVFAMRPVTRG